MRCLTLKYSLFSNQNEHSEKTIQQFYDLAKQYNLTEDTISPDLVISVGGDGTLLEAFHKYEKKLNEVAFIGIHTGHLGFYADWQPKDIEELISLIATEKDFRITEFPLVSIEIETTSKKICFLALNEFAVRSLEKTLVMKVKINNNEFEMFRGDGLCISTPSGSTAYNKSLGGAVIHPDFESIQLSEMSSINNRVYRTIGSSLLLPKKHSVELLPQYQGELGISFDHLNLKIKNILSIKCRVANEKARFARYRSFPFWSRVKESFIEDHHLD